MTSNNTPINDCHWLSRRPSPISIDSTSAQPADSPQVDEFQSNIGNRFHAQSPMFMRFPENFFEDASESPRLSFLRQPIRAHHTRAVVIDYTPSSSNFSDSPLSSSIHTPKSSHGSVPGCRSGEFPQLPRDFIASRPTSAPQKNKPMPPLRPNMISCQSGTIKIEPNVSRRLLSESLSHDVHSSNSNSDLTLGEVPLLITRIMNDDLNPCNLNEVSSNQRGMSDTPSLLFKIQESRPYINESTTDFNSC
eukprot:GDKJ01052405.1.p1 GENE.GDKJ01052405.1~~GDKJ01052405.1.p1  ORF type:complete len:249 (+),score=24.95 GDKJ01052405.1:22-768(+)